jgi:small GTP-binding protein
VITRKLCLLGAFSVGKTSLLRRFVHGVFDERYITTLGVKIDTKTVEVAGKAVKLVIWDIEGADPADREPDLINPRMRAYLQGADGVLLVADGTRAGTLEVARELLDSFRSGYPPVPAVLLLNKSDLADQWQVDTAQVAGLEGLAQSFTTSALSGENVEATFGYLAERLTRGDDRTDGGR